MTQSSDRATWSRLARSEAGVELLKTTRIVVITDRILNNTTKAIVPSQALSIGGCPQRLTVDLRRDPWDPLPRAENTDLNSFNGHKLRELSLRGLRLLDGWEQVLSGCGTILASLTLDENIYVRRSGSPFLKLPTMEALRTLKLGRDSNQADESSTEVGRVVCAATTSLEFLRLYGYSAVDEEALLTMTGSTVRRLDVQHSDFAFSTLTPQLTTLWVSDLPKVFNFPTGLQYLVAPVWSNESRSWCAYVASDAASNLRTLRTRNIDAHGNGVWQQREFLRRLHECLDQRDIKFISADGEEINAQWLEARSALDEDDWELSELSELSDLSG